jgi:hypothetical protein
MSCARVLLLALIALAAACTRPPPEPVVPSPVYEWVRNGEPTFWRYVPLSTAAQQHPTQDDFTAATRACAGEALLECLTERGFYRAQCSDGIDNDGDGSVDHPEDPGCAGQNALEEAPACDDGLDNDGDGFADWDGAGFTHPDPDCVEDPSRDRESRPRRRWPF